MNFYSNHWNFFLVHELTVNIITQNSNLPMEASASQTHLKIEGMKVRIQGCFEVNVL